MRDNIWRYIAGAAIAISLIISLLTVWFFYSFHSNMEAINKASFTCYQTGSEEFDSIQAAEMIGRLDLVSLVLALFGLLLAFGGFFGFWIFRREVIEETRRVAADETRRVAQEHFQKANGNDSSARGSSNVMHILHDELPLDDRLFDINSVNVTKAVEEKPEG